MKGRMTVKWNWRKSRTIFPRENDHLAVNVFKLAQMPAIKLRKTHTKKRTTLPYKTIDVTFETSLLFCPDCIVFVFFRREGIFKYYEF